MKRHSGKHGSYCFKVALMKGEKLKFVRELLITVYSKKRAQIKPLVIYRKSNSKNHNDISIEKILSLCFRDSGLLDNNIFWLGDYTNYYIISYVSLRIKNRNCRFQRRTNPL